MLSLSHLCGGWPRTCCWVRWSLICTFCHCWVSGIFPTAARGVVLCMRMAFDISCSSSQLCWSSEPSRGSYNVRSKVQVSILALLLSSICLCFLPSVFAMHNTVVVVNSHRWVKTFWIAARLPPNMESSTKIISSIMSRYSCSLVMLLSCQKCMCWFIYVLLTLHQFMSGSSEVRLWIWISLKLKFYLCMKVSNRLRKNAN